MSAPNDKAIRVEGTIRSMLREHGRSLLGLLALALTVHDIFGTHGFLAMRRTQSEILRVNASIDQLNRENERLAQEVKDLKSDPRLIEKIAREGLHLAKPGEIIIKIPQSQWPENRGAKQ